MQKRKKVTLKDIAAAVGFDPVSVSRALRGIRELSPENTERVIRVAAEMGYRPNAFAKAMKSGKMDNIAIVQGTKDPRNSTISRLILSSIGLAVERRSHRLILAQVDDDQLNAPEYAPKILSEWIADGIFLSFNCYQPPGLIDRLRRFQIPAIWLNCKLDADCLVLDDIGATRLATEHLLSLGHVRIAYVGYRPNPQNPQEHYSIADRLEGYRQAMAAAGLEPILFLFEEEKVGDVAEVGRWLGEASPTAIVSFSTQELLPAIMAAHGLGWRIPRDLSVLPIQTELPSGMEYLYGIRLSYVSLGEDACGEIAVDTLFRKIASPRTRLAPVKIPFALHMDEKGGTSLAPPRTG
jgi:LacI family transcriptional regulator